jgi:DGQHR domain-containing protein
MKTKKVTIPALRVKQNIGEFYISSISAKDLVEISYSDVRRLAKEERDVERYLGIQRPIKKTRVNQIKKYLEGNDATFPTSVIIAVDEKCVEINELQNGFLQLKLFSFTPDENTDEQAIPFGKIAKVIDGQHRIAAFLDEQENWSFDFSNENSEFEFNLSIFIGADISDQANIFATVNLAQTKVNKSLVYDLTGLSKTSSPYKTCHNVAVLLDGEKSSPFFERIKRLGVATPGRSKEPLTQQSFVESLVRFISPDPLDDRNKLLDGKRLSRAELSTLRKCPFRNLFLDGKDAEIAKIIYNYFNAVCQKWPNSWNNIQSTGNLLPRANAFKALMKFLKDDVYPEIVGDDFGEIPTTQDFLPFLNKADLKDSDFTARNFSPGSSGQSAFLKVLRGELSRTDILEPH